MRLITKILLTALTLLMVATYIPGIAVESIRTAIIAACVLGLLNAIVKPIVIFLTLPVTILTLGLFLFIINASFFAATAFLVTGFTVTGFIPALIGSLIVSFVNAFANRFLLS